MPALLGLPVPFCPKGNVRLQLLGVAGRGQVCAHPAGRERYGGRSRCSPSHPQGSLVDGRIFDTSLTRDPLVIELGQKQVIPGM